MNTSLATSLLNIIASSSNRGFDRQQCLVNIQPFLENNHTFAQDSAFFIRNAPSGLLESTVDSPVLTKYGCTQLCGTKMGVYSDVAPRLLTWFIPCIFLISNITLAPIGKTRFATIVHLLGDPISSIWSLLVKLDGWRCCIKRAEAALVVSDFNERPGSSRRVIYIAMIIAATEELAQPDFVSFEQRSPFCLCGSLELDELYKQTIEELRENRNHGTLQTWLSIMLYIIGVVAAFVPAVGGNPNPSGGKIAPALMLSWLLPVILLGNVVGRLHSPQNAIRTLVRFKEGIWRLRGKYQDGCEGINEWLDDNRFEYRSWNEHLKSMIWLGEVYPCQLSKPWMARYAGRPASILALLSFLPLVIAFIAAFLVLYSAPTYLSCRHFMIIGDLLVWIISTILTMLISTCVRHDKQRWRSLLVKDFTIGGTTVGLLIASSCGLFNNCGCWSGGYTPGRSPAIVLNPSQQFTENNHVVYPLEVTFCLVFQLGIYRMLYVELLGMPGLRMFYNRRALKEELLRFLRFLNRAKTFVPQ